MTSMSHDPAVAMIGGQLTAMGAASMATGAAAAPAVTALPPAGAEEVSVQASMAFAAEASKTLAAHAAAHQEISRTGAALVDITRMYTQADATAAGALQTNAARSTAVEFNSVGTSMSRPLASPAPATRLLRAEAVPGAAGTPVRTPALASLVEGAGAVAPTPAAGAASMPTAMSAASSLLSTPLSTLSSLGSSLGSVGQGGMGGGLGGATAGGASASGAAASSAAATGAAAGGTGPALASSLTEDDGSSESKDADGTKRPGEQVL
jgi:hypothetical protein